MEQAAMSDPNADSTFDPVFQLDDCPSSGGADVQRQGIFNITLNGRRFTVTVSSSRRPLEEMLKEFVEIFGDRITRLH
jgi:hypothetical protein